MIIDFPLLLRRHRPASAFLGKRFSPLSPRLLPAMFAIGVHGAGFAGRWRAHGGGFFRNYLMEAVSERHSWAVLLQDIAESE
jgi:hypothetical protein